MKRYLKLAAKLCISLSLVLFTLAQPAPSLRVIGAANIIRVPQDYSSIQQAVNAAQSGDVILVSPGTYTENITIAGKTLTLASLYYETQDSQYIENTIIDAGGNTGIFIDKNAGPDTTVMGFTITNGLVDGIFTYATLNVLYNHFTGNDDSIDYYGGGGVIRGNIFENGTDDGIDLDDDVNILIEDNIFRNNHQDGIEIRLEEYSGPQITVIIRNNQLIGNGHDGIQLVDYPDVSNRIFYIERNLFLNNNMVGLGMMDEGVSIEDYRAASIPERVHLFNNTFVGNNYAITGGDNLVAVNNIIANSLTQGIKNADGNSIVAYTLFWNNWTDQAGSNIDYGTNQSANPLLDAAYNLSYGSPAIDAGVAEFIWQGETVLNMPATDYFNTAPDLGWRESNFSGQPSPTASWTSTPSATLPPSANPTYTLLDDASIYSGYPTSNYGSAATLEVDNSPVKQFLLKFSLSGVNGRVVTKAILRLYSVGSSNKGGDFYYVSSNAWDERTITWNTAPPKESGIIYSLGSVTSSKWYEINLTSIITGDGIYSFRIESTSTDGADYSSKEGAYPPQLVITVSEPPGGTSTPTSTPVRSNTPTISSTPSSPTSTPSPPSFPSDTPTGTEEPLPTDTITSVPSPTTPPPPTTQPTSTDTVSPTLPPTSTSTITPIPTSTSTATLSPTPLPPQPLQPIYLSLQNAGPTTVGTLRDVTNNDLIHFDGTAWRMFFDGSDVGLTVPVSAFAVVDSNTILLSLGKAANIAPIGKVDVQDIMLFTGTLGEATSGTFSLYFDGSDVGLEKAQESITVLHSLADGRLIIGTKGAASVPGLTTASEDLMLFTPTSTGANTAGNWSLYMDGSDVGLTFQARIDAIAVGPNGNLYLSTIGAFNLGVVSGENEDVIICANPSTGANTACTFSPAVYFDGSQWGLAGDNVDSIGLP
jgi:hypothetical protein